MALIQFLEDEDPVNGAKDILNVAMGEIPISHVLTNGDLVITKRSGETETVPLKNVFAVLNTVFNAILPGLATLLEPGLILLADDENPVHLDAENRVLSAAAVVRLIKAISNGLGDVLKIDNVGFGELKLRIDPEDENGTPATISLYLEGDDDDAPTLQLIADVNSGAILKHKGDNRVIANANGVQLNGSRAFIEGLANASTLFLRQMPTTATASYIAVAKSIEGQTGDSIEKISLPDFIKLIPSIAQNIKDAVFETLALTGNEAYNPASPITGIYVGQPGTGDDTGKTKVVAISPYDLIQKILPALIQSLTAAGYGGGNGGGTTTRQIRLEGCFPEESTGQARQTVLFDHTALNMGKPHNLKTNAVGIAKAYFVADGKTSGVSVLSSIDDYAEFYNTGSDYFVRLKATAPGYEAGKLYLMIERLDSDLTA